ncbi:hypothetical protein KJ780_00270 [Candidatus Micrarchaeota archaeon]|nr:hypothetical protein [Candidatus Micrarchaeota archaeon]
MRAVILDTNFLLVPHQFKINVLAALERIIEGPHELIVSTPIINEVEAISKSKGKKGAAARVALVAIERKKIRCVESEEQDADSWILNYCSEHRDSVVCTNDIDLRQMLKKLRIRVISMRSRATIFWA